MTPLEALFFGDVMLALSRFGGEDVTSTFVAKLTDFFDFRDFEGDESISASTFDGYSEST